MYTTEAFKTFLDSCPTPFQVTDYIKNELKQDGFEELQDHSPWSLQPGTSYFVTRNESALIAFRIPSDKPHGFMIGASHDDSPALKIKPDPETESAGLIRLNVEGYGGLLHTPWFDRPLAIAGRVCVKTPGGIQSRHLFIDRDLCIIPSLAIHMDRSVNTDGHVFGIQKEMLPVFRSKDDPTSFLKLLADELHVAETDILSHDLIVFPHTKAALIGADASMISAPHLDDLQCTFASLEGFRSAAPSESIPMLAVFDHEEVGSTSLQGANGTFLEDTLHRIEECLHLSKNEFYSCCGSSFLLSADNSHAVHPNYPEKADPTCRPKMNGGIVIKYASSTAYLTDAVSSALVEDLCSSISVPVQHFANHSNIPGGSTLGRLSVQHIGIRTADIGLAQLAMHSPYETAGVRDTEYLTKLFQSFYSASLQKEADGSERFVF
jgi:aspartyl aminopeptidase